MTDLEFIPAARPLIGDEERAAVDAVLQSGMLAQGPEVAAFEREFSDALVAGRPTAAVNSGTSGLHLGLLAAGIGPGDEVIVPSFTFAATANAVVLAGAVPVFADIEPNSFNLDPDSVARAIGPNTAAIMPVHLYGHPADMGRLSALAAEHSLALFEDAAQAHAATLDGRQVGTFGDWAMFSLYPTKNMTSGEGGMVVSASAATDERVRLLRNQGMARPYENEIAGFNARMTDLHAAIGRAQLRKLAGWTEQRRRNAARFDAELTGVVTPPVAEGAEHVYHQYTIRVAEDRDGFARALREEHGIGTGVYYPTPVHRLPVFGLELDLPETERAAREALSLPVHPSLSERDVDRIVSAVNTLAKAGS
ncbi:dTDP-4-amino-4,6-dideoxygalactose transaminase [Leifsonia sp. 98AMF]|uniref:DegT/DnrJ/EryC1/StrS family aminotransferase n=1 Tax=unclassified Leifsonia TaxID=2663824 RepID=UPI00087C0732|nr:MULTISPECIES: DegT/DnrJ/EryC1/StrS family aminotransferase [unclassified Leifsonia]SDH20017.1 dTDP-4-amino-4,6-dideoxygalactose transaminase [Leifsonia sp. 197AMF]SDJ18681.1 dTDP-4-amino-4,6-dideoxygalactose transaminase [Leifsonia sp. 466MF]SDJ47917.1 dTDP-4-amino-4,6-dideoxygalactose transaminase [Leifsonia sp. 157MF]SDN39968.1 dTDP-4-amino-4,6-dideoxygalactose transaminase [Leifsonia sp. 509MF]SEM80806.1 dTDP-4-amino-4,6-dideoxygalactose transaminase [Leifsonia sp. 467MF]